MGSRKTFTITFASPRENLQETPTTLPTSEPETPQVSYTVQSSDMPTLNPRPYSCKYIAVVYAAGKFVTAGTLYWRMKKNGSSVRTGSSSISANNYYTVNAFFFDVDVGDVLEIALWSDQTDSDWDYDAIFVYVTRFQPFNLHSPRKVILAQIRMYNENATYPTLTQGNPSKWISYYPFEWCNEKIDDYVGLWSITGDVSINFWSPSETRGLWCIKYHGDLSRQNDAIIRTDSTYRPKYWSNYIRMTTICRPLRVE